MPATDNYGLIAVTVLVYLVALWLPGGLVGAAIGLRGWLLAAVAPLLTYTVAGVFGPVSAHLGLHWNVLVLLGSAVLVALIGLGLNWLANRRERLPKFSTVWNRKQQLVATGGFLLAAVVGAQIVSAATGHLTHIPQDWDAAFHADGIRYIADTGDGSLFGMGKINWYEIGGLFYPNAYHLVGAVVYQLTGTPVGVVLNAQTVLLPAMLALGLVALIRYCKGSALTAAFSALIAVSSLSALYDMLWRGPLLPFATGNVLAPAFVLLAVYFLDKSRLDTGYAFALGAVGLLTVHPSNLFSGIVFLLPLVVSRWIVDRRRIGRELLALVIAAVVGALIAAPQLLGSLGSVADQPLFHWNAGTPIAQAFGDLLTFQHSTHFPQYWLAIPLWIGLIFAWRLGDLRWVLGSAALFGVLFILTASYNTDFVAALTRPWWNDEWRMIALASIPLAVVAGHGMAQVCEWLGGLISRFAGKFRWPMVVATAVVFVLFVLLSNTFYYRLNNRQMARQYGDGPPVTTGEYQAMQWLHGKVGPGERVMNDPGDGSVWMYAVAGVHPVVGHYETNRIGADPMLLIGRFDEYDTNPAVRAAVARLHVRYVMIGQGFVRSYLHRVTGLDNLDQVRELHEVYHNADATIYHLTTATPTE